MKITTEIPARLAPLVEKIQQHSLYTCIDSLPALRIFMEYHVFAVWDFMCLLKELHHRIVSTRAPWFPPPDAASAHLLNRILVEEEGDCTEDGLHYQSHFELYLTAMTKIGADTQPIRKFLAAFKEGHPLMVAGKVEGLPVAACRFVETTFSFFMEKTHELAAAFVYGREAITPILFAPLVWRLEKKLIGEERLSVGALLYYLKRHIELDDSSHFPSALQMLNHLVGEDKQNQEEVMVAAERALQARLEFLSGIQLAVERQISSHDHVVVG